MWTHLLAQGPLWSFRYFSEKDLGWPTVKNVLVLFSSLLKNRLWGYFTTTGLFLIPAQPVLFDGCKNQLFYTATFLTVYVCVKKWFLWVVFGSSLCFAAVMASNCYKAPPPHSVEGGRFSLTWCIAWSTAHKMMGTVQGIHKNWILVPNWLGPKKEERNRSMLKINRLWNSAQQINSHLY